MLILIDGKLLDIDDELLTEKLVITKRKYTDQHPEIIHSTNAPIRNKVLDIVNNNGGIISKTAIEIKLRNIKDFNAALNDTLNLNQFNNPFFIKCLDNYHDSTSFNAYIITDFYQVSIQIYKIK